MFLLALVLCAPSPSAPAALKSVADSLQAIGFVVSKTELDKKSHWVKRTKVAAPKRIDSLGLKRADGAELTAEQWTYGTTEESANAKSVLDREVTCASWVDKANGSFLIVITAAKPEFDEHLKALSAHHTACTLASPMPTLTGKVKDYKIKDHTLHMITESGVLTSGERVQISRTQCASVSVSYRFFVEVSASDAMTKVRELLGKLSVVARKPEEVSSLAKVLGSAWLNADVKIGAYSSVRATYDDRGAEPTLSVEYVDAP